MFANTRSQIREIQKFRRQWKTRREVAAKSPKGEVYQLQIFIGYRGAAARRHSRYATTVNYSAPGDDYDAGERKTISIFWLIHLIEETLYETVYDPEEIPIGVTTRELKATPSKN